MNEPVGLCCPSEWPLQKYARLRQPNETEISTPNAHNANKWILFCSENGDMSLNLTASLQLVITKRNLILESIFLPNAKKHMRAIARGDSVLFQSKITSGTRRFRIKFEKSNSRSGIEQCLNCTQHICNYVNFKTNLTNTTGVPTVLSNEVSTEVMAQAILEPTKYILPTAYRGNAEDVGDSEGLRDVIAFCLADPTFPSFVEAVERCLSGVTSDEDSSRGSSQQNISFPS